MNDQITEVKDVQHLTEIQAEMSSGLENTITMDHELPLLDADLTGLPTKPMAPLSVQESLSPLGVEQELPITKVFKTFANRPSATSDFKVTGEDDLTSVEMHDDLDDLASFRASMKSDTEVLQTNDPYFKENPLCGYVGLKRE